ncbi:hypothetical protein LRM41_03795 [Candidatus Nanosynbacter sp. TM7-087]|uniref:hypothetical protein n=1 Tax=Candidatus Nanosynbacter sp. TM7-087 TaxID=2902631 RepID=UPI001FB641C4|nr:hypothetical protein [Candidatus Nanosynbacter sp. TM7-087]MCJ1966674.1 hypothetical protein [Candidatus Nanosynbacter sp. TM7-087]
MNKENKVILISSVLFLISITATFLIIKNPDGNQYTTILSSSQNANENQSNQNNTHEQPSEKKVITELLNSTSSTYGNRELKKYSIVKEQGEFKLVTLEIYSEKFKSTYNTYAVLRNNSVITGVNDRKSPDALKNIGVPADIINEYKRNRSDV